ncbi:SgcJ/EcaC family oxidoreductase [Hymenobacter sp. BT491]|uniref:SgcJ/EcaC family oxidoreductase n=1 Tax=Hymenobacter sp. BT491 TaxID=2766779 RepID=UPI001653E5F9|nr:SgcJ/EcaC family oxidoreductase [Hymenobacter sp. BT491]MBC6990075.1 SgcJ/EcaC family oxidoreductase [Hymenobacter sp. BT491]
MKTLLLVILCLISSRLTLAQMAPAHLTPTDEKGIRESVNHWEANLNNHRFQEMTAYTTKDISFVTPIGMLWRGQQQLVQEHLKLFTKMYKGVPFKSSEMTIRAIAPDVAVMNQIMAIGVAYPPDGVNRGTNKIGPTRDRVTMTLVKQNGHWLVAAGQVTAIDEEAIKGSAPKVASVKTNPK